MLSKNANIRKLVSDFLVNSEAARCVSFDEVTVAMNAMFSRENFSRMVDGVVFNVSEELNLEAETIARKISDAMGAIIGDEGNFSRALWKRAANRIITNEPADAAARKFLADVDSHASTKRRFITANELLTCGNNINRFAVGSVAIARGEEISADLNSLPNMQMWQVGVGELGLQLTKQGPHFVGVSINNWDISTLAAKENLEEEAAWLAGVAISLLRVSTKHTLGFLVPKYGETEPHPFRANKMENTAITSDGNGIAAGGLKVPPHYVVSDATVDYCSTVNFKTIENNVFSPAPKSIAVRVAQSLGWLARGRQSEDRAERFLFFFTALEALLSSADKTAPVIQTIARNAASILTDDQAGRAKNAKILKDLYAARSALVHTGSRKVTRRDANTIEYITEMVCWEVLDKCDLSQSVEQFHAVLLESSYGSPWGDRTMHRLGASDIPAMQ